MAHILLVEDSPDLQAIYSGLLLEAGHIVDIAPHGQAAIEYLQDALPNAPELVLMDIRMPVLDGLRTTETLRADPRFEALLIIALTAQNLPEEIDLGLAAGCDGYIIKPMHPQNLLNELALVLQDLSPTSS